MSIFAIISSFPRVKLPARRKYIKPPPSSAPPSQRLLSLDALRGFTMFWLIGGRELAIAAAACVSVSLGDAVEAQLTHPHWQGFVAWDTIMPMFLFLVGASMPFALGKRLQQGESMSSIYWRIARRVILLWILGMIAQKSLIKYQISGLELYSNALEAIAVGYLVTSIALLHLPLAGQIGLFAGLTLAYWALLSFVPFAGHPAGTLEQTVNFPRYIDELILGGFRRGHDFTWIVTSLGFSATVLLGAMSGHILRGRLSAARKLLLLVTVGLCCAAIGWLWSYSLPFNRHIWTPSMILWTGGLSFLFLALFYAAIDILGIKAWAFFFVVIGANALFAYVFDQVFQRTMSDTLVANLANQLIEPYNYLISAIGEVALLWLILWYMYRNRTFLRA
jgi:predicted acyltransferase